jgi:hypothetical protein
MKYLSLGVVVLSSAVGLAAQTPAGQANDKVANQPITLTGCVEAGAAPNTFLLTHVVRSDSSTTAASAMPQPSGANPAATPPITTPPNTPPTEEPKPTAAPPATEPAPTATSGMEPSAKAAIYWLDPPDKLKDHVGHKVSVAGTLDDDVDKAKVKSGDDKVKIEAERGSRRVEAREGTTAAAEAQAAKTGDKQESYKIKVKSVTMISGTCS